jgi:hypothetical protein
LAGVAGGKVVSTAAAAARTKAIFIIGVLFGLIQRSPSPRDLGLSVVALSSSLFLKGALSVVALGSSLDF